MLLSIARWALLQLCAADLWRVKWKQVMTSKNVLFLAFLANFDTIKNISKNLHACIIIILDATFVPNLRFLGLLSPEISFGEKKQSPTQTPTQLISPFVNLSALRWGTEIFHNIVHILTTLSATPILPSPPSRLASAPICIPNFRFRNASMRKFCLRFSRLLKIEQIRTTCCYAITLR